MKNVFFVFLSINATLFTSKICYRIWAPPKINQKFHPIFDPRDAFGVMKYFFSPVNRLVRTLKGQRRGIHVNGHEDVSM